MFENIPIEEQNRYFHFPESAYAHRDVRSQLIVARTGDKLWGMIHTPWEEPTKISG